MDSLHDLLRGKQPAEPPEISTIKRYVRQHFNSDVGVAVQDRTIAISAGNASLANALRLRLPEIQRTCQTDKRLTIRI